MTTLKKHIMHRLFFLSACIVCPLLMRANESIYNNLDQEMFTCIYEMNAWLDKDSRSGPGSNMAQTRLIRTLLPEVLKLLEAKTILDAPCGDIYWIRTIDLSFLEHYYGVDIVPQVIEKNKRFSTKKWEFMHRDITRDQLPCADVIFCRDCLPHLKNENILLAIKNFKKSGAKFLITTTYPSTVRNVDLTDEELLHLWRYRRINLCLEPFNFPEPTILIREKDVNEPKIDDKSMGVWRIENLPDF